MLSVVRKSEVNNLDLFNLDMETNMSLCVWFPALLSLSAESWSNKTVQTLRNSETIPGYFLSFPNFFYYYYCISKTVLTETSV